MTTVWIQAATRKLSSRLAAAAESMVPARVVTSRGKAVHSGDGERILLVAVYNDIVRFEWGTVFRDELDQWDIEWRSWVSFPTPRVYDPEATLHGPGKGAWVVDAGRLAEMISTNLALPEDPDQLEPLRSAAEDVRKAEEALDDARRRRDEVVAAAMAAHMKVDSVARASGLSRARVYQVMDAAKRT